MGEIIATLAFDSWMDELPRLRAANGEDRHLIYEGGGVILDLLVRKDKQGGCVHIGGQVLPGDDLVDTVCGVPVMLEQGAHISRTQTNALGEFSFHSVRDGNCNLAITLENRTFLIRGLDNKNPRNWRILPMPSAGGA
jgi:hypothetical protein